MDQSPYTNYRLLRATVALAHRIRRDNPGLWAQIVKDAAEAERQTTLETEKSSRG